MASSSRCMTLAIAAIAFTASLRTGYAQTAAQVTNAAQNAVNFLTPDTVNWIKTNQCTACHRAGGSLYGLSNAIANGYQVDTSNNTGIGYIAQILKDEQQSAGYWTHFGTF